MTTATDTTTKKQPGHPLPLLTTDRPAHAFRASPKPRFKRWLFILLVTPLLLWLLWLARQPLEAFLSLLSDQEIVSAYIISYGAWAPLALAAAQLLQVMLAFIPGHVFVIAAGYIYGFPLGLALNLVCIVGASQLAYVLARWAGRPFIHRLAAPHVIAHWEQIADKKGFIFFTIAFVLPVFPTDLMNFVAGLSGISPRRFLAANFLGRLPSAVMLTLIGSHGLELSNLHWAILAIIVATLYIGGRFAMARIERRHGRS